MTVVDQPGNALRVCSFESRRADEMRSLIERQGALTFGTRNIRALYEALKDTRTGVTS